jgi:cytochrome c5
MEKLAAHDKAMAEAKMNATGFAGAEAVFMQSCTRCHSGPTPKDELSLTSYAKVMKGCDDGPVIVAGNPDASLLVKALHGKGAKQMPPTGPLSEADIKKIVDWIKSGATNSSS